MGDVSAPTAPVSGNRIRVCKCAAGWIFGIEGIVVFGLGILGMLMWGALKPFISCLRQQAPAPDVLRSLGSCAGRYMLPPDEPGRPA